MLCEKCQQRNASVLITKIINGHKTETRLCEVCAQQENAFTIHLEPKMMLHNIFADLFNSPSMGVHKPKSAQAQPEKCSVCGFINGNFTNTGKLGCDRCYDAFAVNMEPLLRKIHGATMHTGKLPKRTGSRLSVKKQIEDYRSELNTAIQREEYEKAAKLRDKIRELETRMQGEEA